MAVHKTLSLYEFEQEFRDFGRDYYSPEAYSYLYELLDENDAELDVIAVCGAWTESSADELWDDYGYMVGGGDLTNRSLKSLFGALESQTALVRLSNGNYLVAAF